MKKTLLFVLCALLLVGCTNAEQEAKNIKKAEVTAVPTTKPTPTPVPKYYVKKWFTVEDGDGIFGSVKVNQVQKLRFNDWSVGEAVKKSINYSYTVNLNLKMTKKITNQVSVDIEPIILRNGKQISKKADAGWSGFSQFAEFYEDSKTSGCFEVGVQPTERVKSSDVLAIKLKYNNGVEKIYKLEGNVLKKAKKGPKLKTAKDLIKIKSKSGAVFAVCPQAVFFEKHQTNADNQLDGMEYDFDINYQMKAFKGPTKNISVANISGYGKNSSIVCRAVIGLHVQESRNILYTKNKNAGRQEYFDNDASYFYVNEGSTLNFGKQRNVITNRVAPDGTNPQVKFVRLRVEFPEEMDVRSDSEKRKFNGRYLVYQMPITQRTLKAFY